MIAHKIIPSFFVVDLEGEATNIEWLFGYKARLKNITINSLDFRSDVEALVAGQEAFDLLKLTVDVETAEEASAYNPEFFLKDPLEPTLEQERDEMFAMFQAAQMAPDMDATVLTRRFDDWGDFVIMKSEVRDSKYCMRLKVAANPQLYIQEKNLEQEEHDARLHGNKLESTRIALH